MTENIDNDRNGKRCLGSGDAYCKEGEKESLQCLGIKVTVKHHKIDIHRIQQLIKLFFPRRSNNRCRDPALAQQPRQRYLGASGTGIVGDPG